ncbi:hypothetical protein OSB04_005672 [Centaurea solstitialis]|uniref:Uncharacterized protein n=1 Tax=Centaurea solstitialis TaxID=347529 RepID=A0AA38WGP9_9ASTR|nr:hypothetical protein OSB04_005672 [Centaurea solstitialis]
MGGLGRKHTCGWSEQVSWEACLEGESKKIDQELRSTHAIGASPCKIKIVCLQINGFNLYVVFSKLILRMKRKGNGVQGEES